MSKRPPAAPVAPRRQLVGAAQSSSAANLCIACSWRKASNAGLRELRASNEDFQREPYSGILAGEHRGQIIVAEYIEDKQVGFIAIPNELLLNTVTDIVGVYERFVARQLAEQLDNEDGEDAIDGEFTELIDDDDTSDEDEEEGEDDDE